MWDGPAYQTPAVEAQDCRSGTDMGRLRDEDVCADGVVSDLFVGGLDDVEAGEFWVGRGDCHCECGWMVLSGCDVRLGGFVCSYSC